MVKKILQIVIVVTLLFVATTNAAIIVTTDDGNGADAYVMDYEGNGGTDGSSGTHILAGAQAELDHEDNYAANRSIS